MPRIIHFDIPADDPARAQKFYQDIFGWKFDKWNGPMEYWMAKTGDDKQPGINGGLAKRMPGQTGVTNTIDVPSVDEFAKKIESKGEGNCTKNGNSGSRLLCTVFGHRRKLFRNYSDGSERKITF